MVLSYEYWVTRFAADPTVIGQKILVNNYPMTIVGVSAPGFAGLDPSRSPQIRVPIQMKPLMTPGWDDIGDRRSQWIQMFARMKPGLHGGSRRRPRCSRSSSQILREEVDAAGDEGHLAVQPRPVSGAQGAHGAGGATATRRCGAITPRR